jgi:hypothetical protein
LLGRYGAIEDFPSEILGERRELALLFKRLATLRTDAPIFERVDELEWEGPTDRFAAVVARIGDARLLARAEKARTD